MVSPITSERAANMPRRLLLGSFSSTKGGEVLTVVLLDVSIVELPIAVVDFVVFLVEGRTIKRITTESISANKGTGTVSPAHDAPRREAIFCDLNQVEGSKRTVSRRENGEGSSATNERVGLPCLLFSENGRACGVVTNHPTLSTLGCP